MKIGQPATNSVNVESLKKDYILVTGSAELREKILKGPSHIDGAYHIHIFLSLYMDLFHISYYTLVGVE